MKYALISLAVIIVVALIVWVSKRASDSGSHEPTGNLDRDEFNSAAEDGTLDDGWLGFGYKTSWYAFKSDDIDGIAKALKLADLRESDWHSFSQEPTSALVRITPPYRGWVLVESEKFMRSVGSKDDQTLEHLQSLSRTLGCEVQFFASYRVVDLYAYAKCLDGEVVRAYFSCEGEVHREAGPLTPEEKEFDVDLTPWDESNDDYRWIDESHIIELAAKWSLNTQDLRPIAKDGKNPWMARLK